MYIQIHTHTYTRTLPHTLSHAQVSQTLKDEIATKLQMSTLLRDLNRQVVENMIYREHIL